MCWHDEVHNIVAAFGFALTKQTAVPFIRMQVIPEVPGGQQSKLKLPGDFSVACSTMPSPHSVNKKKSSVSDVTYERGTTFLNICFTNLFLRTVLMFCPLSLFSWLRTNSLSLRSFLSICPFLCSLISLYSSLAFCPFFMSSCRLSLTHKTK